MVVMICMKKKQIYCNEQAYCINFASMSKNDAFNLIKNSVIKDKKGIL